MVASSASSSAPLAPNAPPSDVPPYSLSLRWRLGISALLAVHLFVIGMFPFTSPPASTFARSIYSVSLVRHYPELIYMDHGYKFFAPNPGVESRQIRWRMTTASGEQKDGMFPHKDENWPRLMYHRHFMLAEHLPFFSDDFVASYARHLLLAHDGETVELFERRSLVPTLETARLNGTQLNDPSLIVEEPLAKYSRGDYVDIENDSVLVRDLPKEGLELPIPRVEKVSSR